jgi:hypothetical protein
MSILQPEASIWYAICCIVVCIRYVSKRMRRGTWRGLQGDDYIVVPAMVSASASIDYLVTCYLQSCLIYDGSCCGTSNTEFTLFNFAHPRSLRP